MAAIFIQCLVRREKSVYRRNGPQELTPEGMNMAAGVLYRLPEMVSLLATSVLS